MTALHGVGLRVLNEQNVIIRNVNISKVLASAGDAIGVQSAHQVWIDHAELSSDRDHDKVKLDLYARDLDWRFRQDLCVDSFCISRHFFKA